MRVVEITIETTARGLPAAERAAWALGAQGLELRDEDTGAPRGMRQVVLWMPASTRRAAVTRLRGALGDASVRTRLVDATWLEPAPPRLLGRRFVVGAPSAGTAGVARRHVLTLDASLTFGDGVHPTTVLCVEALERHFAGRGPRDAVLDVGTGTGVLALVAERLGARRVIATDVDPLARATARENVRAHRRRGGAAIAVRTTLPRERFDLVVANLYLEPLVGLAGALAARTDHTLVVSGFTDDARVVRAFGAHGLELAERTTREGWLCLAFRRSGVRDGAIDRRERRGR